MTGDGECKLLTVSGSFSPVCEFDNNRGKGMLVVNIIWFLGMSTMGSISSMASLGSMSSIGSIRASLDTSSIYFWDIVKPKSSPKSKSQIQVPNPKSKVQRKGTGTADNIILQATHHPPP